MNVISNCLTGTATILTCRKIAQLFSEDIYELSSIRRNWSPDYAENLKSRIDRIIDQYYTPESLKDHLENQRQLYNVMVAALRDISVFRAELKVDFSHDKVFLNGTFENLGYVDYFSDAKNGDQFSLYKLMSIFNQNMTSELKQIICARGIDKVLINRLQSYNLILEDLMCRSDSLSNPNPLNADLKREINMIYAEVKDICRIANAYYEFDPEQRDKFNFYKVLINLEKSVYEPV